MALTIKSFQGDFRVLKAQIAAQYNGVELSVVNVEVTDDTVVPVGPSNPAGKVPVLETEHGVLFESNAIARYVARIRRDTELLGRTFFEAGQVDAWCDFAKSDVEVPAVLWVYPLLNWKDYSPQVQERAEADMHKALSVLESHLLPRTYLVGEAITLADIVCVCTLFYPFKLCFGAAIRDTYPSVTRWFYTCVGKPQFAAVLGFVPVCDEPLVAGGGAAAAAGGAGAGAAAAGGAGAGAGKGEGKKGKGKGEGKAKGEDKPKPEPKVKEAKEPKEAKAKPEKKPKAEEDDDGGDDMAAYKEPAKVDPFAALPKSTMVMDEWKRTYSNSKHDFYAVMPWFWEHLDRAGYSIWMQKYKYNEENKRDFMTSNLVGGFIQRTDELRKYAFGVMHVLNTAAPFEVEGAWLLRGHDIKPMLDANPDAEYYEWTKLDPENGEHRKVMEDYWCAVGKLNGKDIYDTRCFK